MTDTPINMDKEQEKSSTQEKDQRLHLDLLFSKYISRDLAEELTDIANFFSFLSERIIAHRLVVDIPQDLLERFEPVYLILLDKLTLYPSSIRTQIDEIVKQTNICNLMAIAGVLQQTGSRGIRSLGFIQSLLNSVSFDVGVKVTLNNTTMRVTSDTFFSLQVALRRIAGIVRYASSIEFVDYDETFQKFKRNYDPNLVDRSKLIALINILKMEVNTHSFSEERDLLLSKLEHIEEELKRKKIRWGVVITSFFILFGFLADLKTLKPDVYEKPFAIVEQILSALHSDGLVSNKSTQLLGPSSRENSHADSDARQEPNNPSAILPRNSAED